MGVVVRQVLVREDPTWDALAVPAGGGNGAPARRPAGSSSPPGAPRPRPRFPPASCPGRSMATPAERARALRPRATLPPRPGPPLEIRSRHGRPSDPCSAPTSPAGRPSAARWLPSVPSPRPGAWSSSARSSEVGGSRYGSSLLAKGRRHFGAQFRRCEVCRRRDRRALRAVEAVK
jgi:hypothetical protein